MKDMLLSIIIPVYKAERYLDECINSIVSSKSELLEIILIDDGSPDECPKLCDDWVKKDNRIKCIHQNNSGPSVARNKGIKLANGKYLTFVDSDDKLADNSIDKVLDYLKNIDNGFELCFMNINKFYENGKILSDSDKIIQSHIKYKTKEEVAKYLSTRQKFPGSPCSKIYLRETLIKNNIFFPEDNRLAEDLGFVLDCIRYSTKYDSLDFDYYLYRQQQEQTRSNKISDKLINGIQLFISESVFKLCDERKPKSVIDKYYLSFIAYEYQILMYFYYKSKIKNVEFLKHYKWVLKFSNNKRGKIINLMANMLGLKLTSKIISKIKG